MEIGVTEVRDELDAMAAALRYTLGLLAGESPARDSESEVRTLADRPLPVTGLAAARGEGKVRATTSDTYRFFLDTTAPIGRDDHLLIVTSAIAAPFQHAQAIAELGIPTGATITSIGAHINTSQESRIRQTWTTAEWLQEVRSTLWSMKQMCLALEAAQPSLTYTGGQVSTTSSLAYGGRTRPRPSHGSGPARSTQRRSFGRITSTS